MKRVVIVGRGGAGKSTLADRLGDITGLPVIELDNLFWQPGLIPTPPAKWAAMLEEIVSQDAWIIDGDLGPYDVLDVRLRSADTVVLLDFSFARCAWQTIRRSRERADFWRSVWRYRRHQFPSVTEAIARHAGTTNLYVFRSPGAVKRFTDSLVRERHSSASSGGRSPRLGGGPSCRSKSFPRSLSSPAEGWSPNRPRQASLL